LGHVERCAVILHLIDGTADDIVDAYKTIRRELVGYGHGLVDKPEVIGLNKIDAIDPDEVKRKCRALARAAGRDATVLPLSAVSGAGVPEVLGALLTAIEAERAGALVEA
jgi:GTP-binding protein